MPVIKTPGKRPFAPWLRNHRALTSDLGRQVSNADLLLTPLIDMFVILVVFLIMNFSASGDLTLSNDIDLPEARSVKERERAPVIQISADTILVQDIPVASSDEILRDPSNRIPSLTEKLRKLRGVDEMMHPGQPFKGQIIINCDRAIDFKLVRKVMVAAADAGYVNFNYAVLRAGPNDVGAGG